MDRARTAEWLAQLTEGVAALATSESWQRHLEFQGRFHRYSARNVMLIAAQCERATQVASFSRWRALGRCVRKGERAIWILAPVFARRAADEAQERSLCGFRMVPVFDVSQTDGEPLPQLCELLEGPVDSSHLSRLAGTAERLGYRVEEHGFGGAANGDCNYAERRIRLEGANPPAQRLKTLAHELAHALLHEGCRDRALAELEAESVAYVVCSAIGVDSGSYSFGYVTAWAGGGSEAIVAINASCERIQRAAQVILASEAGDFPEPRQGLLA